MKNEQAISRMNRPYEDAVEYKGKTNLMSHYRQGRSIVVCSTDGIVSIIMSIDV